MSLSLLVGRAGRPKKGKDGLPLGFPILSKDKHIMITKLHVSANCRFSSSFENSRSCNCSMVRHCSHCYSRRSCKLLSSSPVINPLLLFNLNGQHTYNWGALVLFEGWTCIRDLAVSRLLDFRLVTLLIGKVVSILACHGNSPGSIRGPNIVHPWICVLQSV